MASHAAPIPLAEPVPAVLPRDGVRQLTGARLVARSMAECAGTEALARWDALARQAAQPNPFFESWYLLPGLKQFDPSGRIKLLVLEQQGEWLGLLPLIASNSYYGKPIPHLATWLHPNCFNGAPLIRAGMEDAYFRALLQWADRNCGTALFLHLSQLPLDGKIGAALGTLLDQDLRASAVVHREERALLCSDLSPEAYLEAAMSGKKRKELRRQFTRLSECGAVAFVRQHDDTGLDGWIDQFLQLEASGWKGAAGSALASAAQTESLFRASLQGATARGRLERLTLTLDGRPLAMLATFLTPPGAYSFKTAFNEDYARFSPGVLLQRENLALLTQPGIAWVDSCAAADHPMIDHLWRERRTITRQSIAIGGSLRRALFRALLAMEQARSQQRQAPETPSPKGRHPDGVQS